MDSSEPKLYHCSLTFLQNQEKDEAREHGHEKTLYEKKKKKTAGKPCNHHVTRTRKKVQQI